MHSPLSAAQAAKAASALQQTIPVAVTARPLPSHPRAGVRDCSKDIEHRSDRAPESDRTDDTEGLSQRPPQTKTGLERECMPGFNKPVHRLSSAYLYRNQHRKYCCEFSLHLKYST